MAAGRDRLRRALGRRRTLPGQNFVEDGIEGGSEQGDGVPASGEVSVDEIADAGEEEHDPAEEGLAWRAYDEEGDGEDGYTSQEGDGVRHALLPSGAEGRAGFRHGASVADFVC